MRRTKIILTLLLLTAIFPICRAQFFSAGDNPTSVRWSQIQNNTYKVIYPKGLDSLAREYLKSLEDYRIGVARTSGYVPGEHCRRIPVILHPYNAYSNGSVSWAPRQMNLYTTPMSYAPVPMPWMDMLTIHEQRHVAQMQQGLSGAFRPFNWFFGEMFNGFVAGLWPSKELLEGDAVVAETALSQSGRGRTADFLDYFMMSFDNGDFRSWHRWRGGSQKYFTPDHYAVGYLFYSGLRFRYQNPEIVEEILRYNSRRPYDVIAKRNIIKKKYGINVATAFREICDTMNTIWQQEMESRKPYTTTYPVVKTPSRYTEYSDPCFWNHRIYAIQQGLTCAPTLVGIDTLGKVHTSVPFSYSVSGVVEDEDGRIYWSETVPSLRWSMKSHSIIRYMDLPHGRKHSLTHKGKLYSPCLNPDQDELCATEYYDDGRTGLTILETDDGERIASKIAPDSLQIIESAWLDDTIYVTALSRGGYGIYSIPEDFSSDFEVVVEPIHVRITDLAVADDDNLCFTSDRTGAEEFYTMNIHTKEIFQLTSTRYGVSEGIFSPDGKYVYFCAKRHEGHLIRRSRTELLAHRKVDFRDIHYYPVAEELSRQEKELTARKDSLMALRDSSLLVRDTLISEPKPYRKIANLVKIHSWAPVYFNVDRLMDFNIEPLYQSLSLGTAFVSQNDLGTAVLQGGYSAHKDPYNKAKWRHSGHLSFKYSGLYPVLTASIDINDRGARWASIISDYRGTFFRSHDYGKPYVNARLSAYVPLNFSRGGWSTALIPRATYNISNDYVHTSFASFARKTETPEIMVPDKENDVFSEKISGKNVMRQYFLGSVQFYTLRPTAASAVYPKWGFVAEAGAVVYPNLMDYYPPVGYMALSGYLPGVVPQQGLNLKVLCQKKLRKDMTYFDSGVVDTSPRGLSDNAMVYSWLAGHDFSAKFSANYAIPIYIGDPNFGQNFMYIKRMIVTPHFDYTLCHNKGGTLGGLFSAGATLALDFSSLFWIRFPIQIGVTYSYNGGPSFKALKGPLNLDRHFVGPVFSIAFE